MYLTVQAKAQFYMRTHAADESKNEYASQLQSFNAEQWKHFHSAIPQIFKVTQTRQNVASSPCWDELTDFHSVIDSC